MPQVQVDTTKQKQLAAKERREKEALEQKECDEFIQSVLRGELSDAHT